MEPTREPKIPDTELESKETLFNPSTPKFFKVEGEYVEDWVEEYQTIYEEISNVGYLTDDERKFFLDILDGFTYTKDFIRDNKAGETIIFAQNINPITEAKTFRNRLLPILDLLKNGKRQEAQEKIASYKT